MKFNIKEIVELIKKYNLKRSGDLGYYPLYLFKQFLTDTDGLDYELIGKEDYKNYEEVYKLVGEE